MQSSPQHLEAYTGSSDQSLEVAGSWIALASSRASWTAWALYLKGWIPFSFRVTPEPAAAMTTAGRMAGTAAAERAKSGL
jgi:hypothetical protein